MESNKLKYEFELKQRDIVELMRFLPARKIVFGILMIIIIPLIIIIREFITPPLSESVDGIETIRIILNVIILIIGEVMAYIAYKMMPKISGKSLYRKINKKNGEKVTIIYNKETGDFYAGSQEKKLIPSSKLLIVSTKRNYLFYFGKGIYSKRFYIPKSSSDDLYAEIIEGLPKDIKIVEHKEN